MAPPSHRHGYRPGSPPLHEVLLVLGGSMALALGAVSFLIGAPGSLTDLGPLTALVANVTGGLVLIWATQVFRRSPTAGFLLAFGASLLLIGLGNLAGVLAAPFAFVGSVYGVLTTHAARRRIRLTPSRGFRLRRSRPRPRRS